MSVPVISIIMPVFNAEQYLSECIESVLGQSYTDFELLIVDDGSTDGSAYICQRYAESDKRVVYMHKENGGVSSARNVGIKVARGTYLMFIDADDMLMPDALSLLHSHIADPNISLSIGTYLIEADNGSITFRESRKFCKSLTPVDCANIMFLDHLYGYQGYLWNKMFRKETIFRESILFDEDIALNEDRLFCVTYISKMTGNAVFFSTPVYHYYHRPNSAFHALDKKFSPKITQDFDASMKMLEILCLNSFPRRTQNLSRDCVLRSYDMLRHHVRDTHAVDGISLTAKYKKLAIERIGGRLYYMCNRVRRFLSKQINFVRKKQGLRHIYLEHTSFSLFQMPQETSDKYTL